MDHLFQFQGGSGLPSHEVPAPSSSPRDTTPHVFASGSLKSFAVPDLSRLDPFQRHALGEFPDIFAPESPKAYGGGYGLSAGYGMWAGALLAGLRANAPGSWSADRLRQANHFVGIAFTAISAMCDGVSSATLEVTDMDAEAELRNHVQKSVSHTGRVGTPIPYDHDVYELFRDPNPNDTFKDILYKTVQQLCLTGNNLTWMVPNRLALPSELYSIPTALAYPVPYSQAWPRGAWRLTPLYPYGPFAILPTPVATAGAVVPADDVLHIKMPHPLLTWDGYSPLTAGARQIDIMEMIDDSRWASFDGGINPSMIFEVDPEKSGVNFNQDTLDRFSASLTQKYANTRNFGKGMILPPGVTGKPTSHPPADMAFDGGWEQMRDFILSLWRVPKGVVGITESSSYAALYASLKQFALIGLKPMAERIAEHWTKKLGKKYKKSLIISLPLPALDDPQLLEEQLKTDLQAGTRTKGEFRTLRGLPLFGDERDDEIAGAPPAGETNLPGMDPSKASSVTPKDKPGSAPVSERRDEADDARPNNTDGLHSLPGMGGAKSLPTGPQRLHKYASTQFNLPSDIATRIQAIGLRIRDDELAGPGIERLSHITIKYGLLTDNAEEVAEVVRGFGPIVCRLGRTGVFFADPEITASVVAPGTPVVIQPERGHAEFDVLKVDIHSERLVELNKLLSDSFPHADTHRTYSPHATCCYLKPGVGKNYLGSTELEGTEVTFTHIQFSDRDGHATSIPLIAARVLPFTPVNGHAKMMAGISSDLIAPPTNGKPSRLLRPDTDTLPLPAPSRPRRSLPFTGRKQGRPRATGDLTTIYPPPDARPYPDANLAPPPGPAAPAPSTNAVSTSGVWWHPPEFEWRLFQSWANSLPNYYPSLHNLSEYGWARGPRIVATETLSALTQTPVVSPELKMAILALIAACESTANETSVFVQPEPGPNPGPALVTDMKAVPTPTPFAPQRRKGEWSEAAHPRATSGEHGGEFTAGGSGGASAESSPTEPPSKPKKSKPKAASRTPAFRGKIDILKNFSEYDEMQESQLKEILKDADIPENERQPIIDDLFNNGLIETKHGQEDSDNPEYVISYNIAEDVKKLNKNIKTAKKSVHDHLRDNGESDSGDLSYVISDQGVPRALANDIIYEMYNNGEIDIGDSEETDVETFQLPKQKSMPAIRKNQEWSESKHPRADDGKFGSGGGGKPKTDKTAPPDAKADNKTQIKPKDADNKTKLKPKAESEDQYEPVSKGNAATPRSAAPRANTSPTIEGLATGKEFASAPIKGGFNRGTEIIQLDTPSGAIRGVFKPTSGEANTVVNTKTGETFPLRATISGNFAGREVASSEVADLIGLSDLIPATVMRGEGADAGSCQEFIPDAPTGWESLDEASRKAGDFSAAFDGPEDAARAAAFDFLTMNTDRHFGNWLLSNNGQKIVLIDNGLSFPDSHDTEVRGNSAFLEKAFDEKTPIPPAVKEWAAKKDAILTAMARNGLSDTEQSLTASRLDMLSTAENFHDLKKNAGINANFFKGMTETEIQAEERKAGHR